MEVGNGTPTTVPIKYDLASSNDLFIGSYIDTIEVDYHFSGAIDEVTVFSEALTPQQVATLYITGPTAIGGNQVQGNYIGTTADGMSGLRNDGAGVSIVDSSDNLIGGPELGSRNVISGNDLFYYQSPGVSISGPLSTANRVVGNFIGLAADGVTAVGNGIGVIVQARRRAISSAAPPNPSEM